jgi:hypothetical protein
MEYVYYVDNQQVKEEQEIKLLKVYNNHNEEIDGKIVAFWIKENALPNYEEEFLQSRINDVVYVCLDSSNDEIVGVCSGNSVYFEQLRNHFFYLRIFVAEKWRGNNRNVAINLYYGTYDLLNELKVFNLQNIVGILIVYESEHLNKVINYYHSEKYRNQVLVGFTDKNEQIRITYFNDVKMF